MRHCEYYSSAIGTEARWAFTHVVRTAQLYSNLRTAVQLFHYNDTMHSKMKDG